MAISSRKGRIGQSQYWAMFALYFVAVLGLGAFAIYSLVTLSFGQAIGSFLLIAPLGIYFRVVMMRRCRDIGWPAFLPWLFFVIPVGFNFMGGLAGVGSPSAIDAFAISALIVPLILSLLDLAFAIVIGCIRTKEDGGEDYARIFGDEAQPARPAWPRESSEPANYHEPLPAGDYSRFDAAVARALEAHRNAETAPQPGPRADPPIPASAHARAVAGFGRKAV